MNEFIEEYGSLVMEALTAGAMIILIYYALSTGATALDREGLNGAVKSEPMPSYIENSARQCPELTVVKEIELSSGEELDVKKLIKSAFGRKQYDINILSKSECRSKASIRNALKEGTVNVAYYHDIKERKGTYRLVIYAKDSGQFGQWTEAECKVVYKEGG